MVEDHRPNTPVTPHGPPSGGPVVPHGAGSSVGSGAHDDHGILIPSGITLLATDPPPGSMLLSTEIGEVFLMEFV